MLKQFCNLKQGKVVSKNILYLIAMNQELKSPATVSRQPLSPEPYNPFNMRLVMLQNLYNWHCTNKTSSRSLNLSLQRNKHFSSQNPEKALDLLRQVVQNSINKEIDAIIQNYMQKFFAPAIVNIRRNGSDVTDEQIHLVCRQILEEAKKMYLVSSSISKENEYFEPPNETKMSLPKLINKHIPLPLRTKKKELESDTESEASQASSIGPSLPKKRPKVERNYRLIAKPPINASAVGSSKQIDIPLKDLPKWNPDRFNEDCLFVLGSKANTALGLSAQRGRIYMKHPGLFRYIGDSDDKQWLFENKQKSVRAGGKAFILLLDDIKELAASAEYRSNPSVSVDDLHGFTLPTELVEKIKLKTSMVYNEMCKKHGVSSSVAVVENVIPDLQQEISIATTSEFED